MASAYYCLSGFYCEHMKYILELETKLTAAEADAARYRWWVQTAWFYRSPLCLQQAWPKHSEIGIGDEQTKKEAIDAAIDAARQKETVTEYYAESRRGDRRYSPARIAWELERTAMGDAHYGNALRVAKDLPEVTAEDRSLLDRYATGKQSGTDHIAIQKLAGRIYAAALDATRSEV